MFSPYYCQPVSFPNVIMYYKIWCGRIYSKCFKVDFVSVYYLAHKISHNIPPPPTSEKKAYLTDLDSTSHLL